MIQSEDDARSYAARLCDSSGLRRLGALADALVAENEQQNLVARNSIEVLWQRHIADSLQLLDIETLTGPWLDLGSGAGFPGLAVAAARPDLDVILVESRKRRVEWLEHCVSLLDLPNCSVQGRKLEQVHTIPAGVISARAFAPLERLLRLSARFSTSDTLWLLPKGRSAAQEVADLPKLHSSMFHVKQSLTDAEAGIIVGRGQWKEMK